MEDTFELQSNQQQREKGNVGEEMVLNKIKQRYKRAFIKPFKEGVYYAGDIIIPENSMMHVEVKTDYVVKNTKQVVVEKHDCGKPSGILTTESKYWIFISPAENFYWLISVEALLLCLEDRELTLFEYPNPNAIVEMLVGRKQIQHSPNFFNDVSKKNLDLYYVPIIILQHFCKSYGYLDELNLDLIC
jgi:hypothetical protein